MGETLQTIDPEILTEPQLSEQIIDGVRYFKISGSNRMTPFFMSIVSSSDHWMFISSNGGLTAGRKNSDQALFPYETDDKIVRHTNYNGSKTIVRIVEGDEVLLWEPFASELTEDQITRNIYKSKFGDSIIFEEINSKLELSFSYQWSSSHEYGFVRKSNLKNIGGQERELQILDGFENILPYGVGQELQTRSSNLSDAYKRSELHKESGIGIYALSAKIVDKAEPAESLFANICFGLNLLNPQRLLCSKQISAFINTGEVKPEADIKAEKGAYLVAQSLVLPAAKEQQWYLVADIKKDQSDIVDLMYQCQNEDQLVQDIEADIRKGTDKLVGLIASSDGLQKTKDSKRDARHTSNVLFNIFRGGLPLENYSLPTSDFLSYLKSANREVWQSEKARFENLPSVVSLSEIKQLVDQGSNPDLYRLTLEYLPFTYSRRHGDPSRPWNQFSINTRKEEDGSINYDYEGNWRDIFQNWEALAYSYPAFIEGMIFKFLNASTFDGYNPYRVMKGGIDWEVIEEDDPWSYIGYWGDHQIIYLLKFLEFIHNHQPGTLESWLGDEVFVYAQVPYRIKNYEEILKDPKDTIVFDHQGDLNLRQRMDKMGADGVLHLKEDGHIYHVNLLEKLLATLLAKVSNLVPDGGIWMNTQRPEWNDANNALVGNGLSMVTLYYLRRFMNFFEALVARSKQSEFRISSELVDFYKGIRKVLTTYTPLDPSGISKAQRREILNQMGRVASDYRNHIYSSGFWGKKRSVSKEGLLNFAAASLEIFEQSIKHNERPDELYHSYNLLSLDDDKAKISYLTEMLEGQVAVLSSAYLKPKEALAVLDALKSSSLFRPDQYSYILYPNKELPGFLDKNVIPKDLAQQSSLIKAMREAGDTSIIFEDRKGVLHFNGNFQNVSYLEAALDELSDGPFKALAGEERELLKEIYEEVFNHKEFTGRSGTFFGYEGLGSIYWHMVSKLLVAVQESALAAIRTNASEEIVGRLLEHYYEIQAGIGVHKSPKLYGAFPTDPYSHTPYGKGAQQPGMTGQVKEDILCRFGELGVFVKAGKIYFHPCLLRKREEFLTETTVFQYIDVFGQSQSIELKAGQMAYTYCQIPIVYTIGEQEKLVLHYTNGESLAFSSLEIPKAQSEEIFMRTGMIQSIEATVTEKDLK